MRAANERLKQYNTGLLHEMLLIKTIFLTSELTPHNRLHANLRSITIKPDCYVRPYYYQTYLGSRKLTAASDTAFFHSTGRAGVIIGFYTVNVILRISRCCMRNYRCYIISSLLFYGKLYSL